MENKIRLALADDHTMLVEGIEKLLKEHEDLEVVFTARDGADFLEKLQAKGPLDVAVLDFDMPNMNAVEVVRLLRTRPSAPQVLIVSLHKEAQIVRELHALGIRGYILKEQEHLELVRGIRKVAEGGTFWGEGVLDVVMSQPTAKDKAGFDIQLTKREMEVLELLAEGLSSSKIGEQLYIATTTVDTHRRNLIAKFGVENTMQLVRAAQKAKLLK